MAVQKENTRTKENPWLLHVYVFHGTTVINGKIRCRKYATTFNLTDHVSWSHDESPLLISLIVVAWDSTLPRLAYIKVTIVGEWRLPVWPFGEINWNVMCTAEWRQVRNSPGVLHSRRAPRLWSGWWDGAQLMACWWPDCSGPAAHWAVIATAGASGVDSSSAPIASRRSLPPSTACPDWTSHDAICLDRWKDRGLKSTYIFLHWFVFSLVSLGSSINLLQPHFITQSPHYLSPSWSFSSSHPRFCFHICFLKKPSPTLSVLSPRVHIHLFGSLPPWRE